MEDAILKLADQFGIVVTDIHGIYTNAIAGLAIIEYITFLMFIVLTYISFRACLNMRIKLNKNSAWQSDNDRDSWGKFDSEDMFSVMTWTVVGMIVVFVFSVVTYNCIAHVLYPEYYAIKSMLYIIQ